MQQSKKRKQKVIDPLKQEETAQKVAAVEAKRQKVISEVELSLKSRRLDRKAIENARFDMEESIRQREIRDAKKLRTEEAMGQVGTQLFSYHFVPHQNCDVSFKAATTLISTIRINL